MTVELTMAASVVAASNRAHVVDGTTAAVIAVSSKIMASENTAMPNVMLKDFQPISNWKIEVEGEKWPTTGEPKFLIDLTTGRPYLNQKGRNISCKCLALSLATPLVHPFAAAINALYALVRIFTSYHFSKNSELSFKESLKDTGADALRIIFAPLGVVGLELAAIYGLFKPNDGRKLYATIERSLYGKGILAPCFQPRPTHHLLGADMNNPNGW